MKKSSKVIVSALVTIISWVAGAIAYFMVVASYYRKKESREENSRIVGSYINSVNLHRNNGKPTTKTFDPTRKPSPHPRAIRDPQPSGDGTPNYQGRQFDISRYDLDWSKYYQNKPKS